MTKHKAAKRGVAGCSWRTDYAGKELTRRGDQLAARAAWARMTS
jgi:hypothetical protein